MGCRRMQMQAALYRSLREENYDKKTKKTKSIFKQIENA